MSIKNHLKRFRKNICKRYYIYCNIMCCIKYTYSLCVEKEFNIKYMYSLCIEKEFSVSNINFISAKSSGYNSQINLHRYSC